MKVLLMCEGRIVNTHSEDRNRRDGWMNPFEVIPPRGTIIRYKEFSRDDTGVVCKFRVEDVQIDIVEERNSRFYTECKIILTEVY
jgi:hypothetical protein